MTKRDLSNYKPYEQGRNKRFVSEENKRMHIGDNPNALYCRHYHVDGYILQAEDGKKCDYLLVNDDGKDAYFIELKGSEIDKAPEQIESAIAALKDSLKGYYFFQRIVCSKAGTHAINSSAIVRWKQKYSKKHHGQPTAVLKESSYTDLMVQ